MSQIIKIDMKTLYPLIEDAIKGGGDVKLKVSGFSMYPLIANRRDSVLLTKAENIKVGDVAFFKRKNGKFILHRIVGKKNGAYKICGDYEQKIEYPVYPEQIVAVAKAFYRRERYISCNSLFYKCYKLIWMNTMMIRPFLLKIIAIIAAKKSKKNVES